MGEGENEGRDREQLREGSISSLVARALKLSRAAWEARSIFVVKAARHRYVLHFEINHFHAL